jgi:S1-C subfamily serine protease
MARIVVSFWLQLELMSILAIAFTVWFDKGVAFSRYDYSPNQSVPIYSLLQDNQSLDIQKIAQLTTVRILTPRSSGSGVIVARQGQIYSVLTNWHVVGFADSHTIMTVDGHQYMPISQNPRQLDFYDLAITQFRSTTSYEVAKISIEFMTVGDQVWASGFPMYQDEALITTFDKGVDAFRLTSGEVTLLPPKSMPMGYRLGYTNEIVEGMSGGPIFNAKGLLIGINGRLKYGEPAFGIYEFEDGTQPSTELLEKMVDSSWGIPITTYLQFVSHD